MRDILKFIYLGEVYVNDLVPFLNAGEELEVYGLLENDALESERPDDSKPNSNIINVFARTQQIEQNKRVDIKDLRRQKSKTPTHIVSPKKVANVRKPKAAKQTKIKVEKPAKAVAKTRAATRSKWQENERPDSDEEAQFINLTQTEFESLVANQVQKPEEDEEEVIFDEEEVVWNEEDGAVGFTQESKQDEEVYVVDQTEDPPTSKAMKRKRTSDRNNNASCSYESQQFDWQMDDVKGASEVDEDYFIDIEDQTDCDYDSNDCMVSGPLVLYGKNFKEVPTEGYHCDDVDMLKAPAQDKKVNRRIGKSSAAIDENGICISASWFKHNLRAFF